MSTRGSPGPATLRRHNAVIGSLRAAGFSVAMTAHALSVLDCYIYGFALQEATLPFGDTEEEIPGGANDDGAFPAEDYPHLAEFTVEHVLRPGYDYGSEFEFGLDLVLDGLGRAHVRALPVPGLTRRRAGG